MSDITIRRMTADDEPAVLALIADSMGWDSLNELAAFFRWKHRENPFGQSPAWVAEAADGRLAGVRVLLRWQFARDGQTVHAVRAVDTATHREFRGQGVFTTLTLGALAELADERVAFVFNTPNDQSLPGYQKMGWQVVGRLPVGLRVRTPTALPRIVGARVAADRSSQASRVGAPAGEVLAKPGVERLLKRLQPPPGLWTNRTAAYLRWRYGLPQLAYRALQHPDGLEKGVVVFRVRRRGAARELVVAEALCPDPERTVLHRLVAAALRATRADYALRLIDPSSPAARLTSRLGPVLTWRAVAEQRQPELAQWRLALGDVELF